MPETQNPDRATEAPPGARPLTEQAATIKTCEATLGQLDELLAHLAAHRESAWGAIRARRLVEMLRSGLAYEFPALAAEDTLDQLLAADGWHHPTQVLEGPFRDWGLLLRVCEERMKGTNGSERSLLEDVRRKVARAHRLDEEAESARYRRKLAKLRQRGATAAADATQPEERPR